MKIVHVLGGLALVLVSAGPSLADSSDYVSLWPQATTRSAGSNAVQHGRAVAAETPVRSSRRAITGEQREHLKAPIYALQKKAAHNI